MIDDLVSQHPEVFGELIQWGLLDALAFVDDEGIIRWVNDGFDRLLEAGSPSLGRPLDALLGPATALSPAPPSADHGSRSKRHHATMAGVMFDVLELPLAHGRLVVIRHDIVPSEAIMGELSKLHDQVVNTSRELAKKNAALQRALDRIETLEGVLPMCASCRRIRDDDGSWSTVEAYVEGHSKASFTHSICPECTQKLYPGFRSKKGERP